jgi:death-on-curing protein
VAHADGGEVAYLSLDDFHQAVSEALGVDIVTAKALTNDTLAGSALAAPAAGFGDVEKYLDFATKTAVLVQAVASNHSLPDGNKRTSLLCGILFAAVNGYVWVPPEADEPDGSETAEVIEAASTRSIPIAALAAWIDLRLMEAAMLTASDAEQRPRMVIYPAEYVGALEYNDNTIEVGDIVVADVHGYNPAGVYVRRIGGKTDGISVAEIIISVVGDAYAQEELDEQNAEAARYPLGAKEYWRARLVGKATFGPDDHPMTEEEFEEEWG